jgi:hypothetical protein
MGFLPEEGRRPDRHLSAVILACALAATAGCMDRGPAPSELEETATATEDVPEVVRQGAEAVAGRIGQGRCEAWYWDSESRDWECEYVGLSRPAELDISTEGAFLELELVYELAEVEAALSEEAAFIHESCRDEPGELIELSLRSERHLNPIPDLAEAWKLGDVVLEFQCPNGVDYELDALHKGLVKQADDKQDVSGHGQAGK